LSTPEAGEARRLDGGERSFPSPWTARSFALAVALQERGAFTAGEWAEALGAALRRSPDGPADPEAYWRAWLGALEDMLERKQLARPGDLPALQEAWRRAAERTPHGQPIELGDANQITRS
jgi:nitrile hydratase accessory protein